MKKKEFKKLQDVLKNNPQVMYKRYKEGKIGELKKLLRAPYLNPRTKKYYKSQIENITKDYDAYMLSIKPKKKQTSVVKTNTTTANSAVVLKQSDLKTSVQTKNISAAKKAKVSVGAISIGK